MKRKFYAITFSYRYINDISNLQSLNQVLKGKGKIFFDPDDGTWKLHGSFTNIGIELNENSNIYMEVIHNNYEPFDFGKNIYGYYMPKGLKITLELSYLEAVKKLSNYNTNNLLQKALEVANEKYGASQKDFIFLFGEAINNYAPSLQLNEIFNVNELTYEITSNTTNEEVLKVLKKECTEIINKSMNIIRNRIVTFGYKGASVSKSPYQERIIIQIPEIKGSERIRQILKETWSLKLMEPYKAKETKEFLTTANIVLRYINKAHEELRTNNDKKIEKRKIENPLFSVFQFYENNSSQKYDSNSSIVGFTDLNNVPYIDSILNTPEVKNLFPIGIRFAWSKKSSIKEFPQRRDLFALRTNSDETTFGSLNTSINYSKEVLDKYGYAGVAIYLNSIGEDKMQSLKMKGNVKEVLLVLDNYVLCLNKINGNSPINNLLIKGNYSKDEVQFIINLLKCGNLPAHFNIVVEEAIGN
ncbi:MAG: hypothetical protein ACOYMA_15795 [Bacteroidia bacterium]